MPHVSSGGGGDDLGSTDEVKVFKDEGEDEKRSSENLTEEKSSLIDLTESEEKSGSLPGQSYSSSKNATRSDHSPVFGKVEPTPHTSSFNMGYLVSPYPYPNGTAGPIPVSMASKMGLAPTHPGATLPFFCHNGEHLTQPPPAHMGIPPYQLDGKGAGAMGLTRPPMYPFSTGQYPYPMLSPEMSQVAASWHTPSMYPISTAGAGFRSPYPTSLPITSTSLSSDFYRFSPTGLLPAHPGLSPHSHPHSLASHPAIVTPGPKQELAAADHNHRSTALDQKNSTSSTTEGTKAQDSAQTSNNQDKKKPHIKKPLNAFMLYMKEMRAKVVAECTLKESAAINQILGRRWHSLSREEQAKYYEKARQERQLHMQLYPGWSARDNYGYGAKKKKRKKERSADPGGNSMKKCRARYGLDQQNQWCKPCRRKKKCIRYMESGESADGNQSEDNLGSCGSAGEAHTPPDDDADGDGESLPHSLSSPGGLSGLSSLTSPSMILPSPGTSLASPSVSLASPCVSLQSPLTPHDPSGSSAYECKPPVTNSVPLPLPPPSLHHHHHPPHQHHPPPGPQPHRNPVGTNPRDVNNPLSVNQLTGQCIKSEGGGTGQDSSSASRPVISVT
ncbi:protein pangolin, isoforms A/H/I/S isoform X3 [Schistocerca gregaria]|uniref:protein pangolin, isoforms A/H/I/S isoform X3 n=1 Tax=Schistocerca gregaria TaxID=7010 RepID=UPI00211E18D9|nr:protein pangolin, isoforms A/H/I/S isoform X3 [Schistocerca gregaria]